MTRVDLGAIVDRIHRLTPDEQVWRDVDTIVAEHDHAIAEANELKRQIGAIAEQLGKLQRLDRPDSDNRT